ncbi:MAG: hypothetical protein M3139_16835, partial [Bacteroidota bacterium]|nr:hypothetical protein [Bacteroidota bacterium]
ANFVNVKFSDFNLPLDLNGLKQITKTQNIDMNIEFYQFIKSLINKKAPGLIVLKKWIEAFKTNTIEDEIVRL